MFMFVSPNQRMAVKYVWMLVAVKGTANEWQCSEMVGVWFYRYE